MPIRIELNRWLLRQHQELHYTIERGRQTERGHQHSLCRPIATIEASKGLGCQVYCR